VLESSICPGVRAGRCSPIRNLGSRSRRHAAIGLAALSIGQTIFVGGDRASIEVGANGLSALIAYPASVRSTPFCTGFPGDRPDLFSLLLPTWETHRPWPRRTYDAAPQIAVIGNSLPRRCRNRQHFSTDLPTRDLEFTVKPATCIVAMTDHDQTYDLSCLGPVADQGGSIEEYVGAAAFLNAGRFDIVACSTNSEFSAAKPGLISGTAVAPDHAGRHDAAHGSGRADAAQRAVMERIVEASSKSW